MCIFTMTKIFILAQVAFTHTPSLTNQINIILISQRNAPKNTNVLYFHVTTLYMTKYAHRSFEEPYSLFVCQHATCISTSSLDNTL